MACGCCAVLLLAFAVHAQEHELHNSGTSNDMILLQKSYEIDQESQAPTYLASTGTIGAPLPPLIFLKTHKTGSSTIVNVLHRLAERRELSVMLPWCNTCTLGWPGSFPGSELPEPSHQYDLIVNHAVWSPLMLNYVRDARPYLVTVVREPIARTISAMTFFEHKSWWCSSTSCLKQMAEAGNMSALEGLPSGRTIVNIRNAMAFDLGWYDRQHNSTEHDHDNEAIGDFVRELDTRFDLVMVTEEMDKSLVMLAFALGEPIEHMGYLRMKEQSHTKARNITTDDLDLVAQLNIVDAQIYAHFASKLRHLWPVKRGHAAWQTQDSLERLRSFNEHLPSRCDEGDTRLCPDTLLVDNFVYTERLRNAARKPN